MAKHLSFRERQDCVAALRAVTEDVGNALLGLRHDFEIVDTHIYKGHESSTLDIFARDTILTTIDRYLPNFEGTIRTELRPYTRVLVENTTHNPMYLVCDELEGTTNAKRCFSSPIKHRPMSTVSMALLSAKNLGSLIASAVFLLNHTSGEGRSYSAVLVEHDQYLVTLDRTELPAKSIADTHGDSINRILVIGYSNSHRIKKGRLEQLLADQKFRIYDGCRASSMDVINIIRNQYDAYVDLRHFWSTKGNDGVEKEAMLEVYDIAGVLPIALGCGLIVTDAMGSPLGGYELDATIPLVIARPDIHEKILETIRPLVEEWNQAT